MELAFSVGVTLAVLITLAVLVAFSVFLTLAIAFTFSVFITLPVTIPVADRNDLPGDPCGSERVLWKRLGRGEPDRLDGCVHVIVERHEGPTGKRQL